MAEVLWDAFIDSAAMIPFLLLVYIAIEFLENRFGSSIKAKVKNFRKSGPFLGAFFGVIPQCGLSVVATDLYSQRLITVGTLLAVYLSTSDEAIPIILAQPDKIGLLVPLIGAKLIIALVTGYAVDFMLHRTPKSVLEQETCAASDGFPNHQRRGGASDSHKDDLLKHEVKEMPDIGCCGHSVSEKLNFKQIILHPVIHTIKVFVFVFVISLILNVVIYTIGEENLSNLLLSNTVLQPLVVAIVGLIPNCAASIAITEVFLRGGISFGSAIGGLSTNAGFGMLVLFKYNRSFKENIAIISTLLVVSIVAGIVIQTFYG